MVAVISHHDSSSEGFYHGMVLGLVASLASRYHIRSNREAGEGRFDLEMEPIDRTLPGILMEFKAIPSSNDVVLEKLAEEALRQTFEKEYHTELTERGIENIVRYGIAFSGKRAFVKTMP